MTALTITLAEAVKDSINAATTFSQQFTAHRVYKPKRRREAYEKLLVDVIAGGKSRTIVSRSGATDESLQVLVGMAKAVDFVNTEDADEMANLTEEMEAHLIANRSITSCKCVLQNLEYGSDDRVYSEDMISQHDLFFSVLVANYKLLR